MCVGRVDFNGPKSDWLLYSIFLLYALHTDVGKVSGGGGIATYVWRRAKVGSTHFGGY